MRTRRPPIPVELHRLKGTYRPHRHDKRAPATVTPGELSAVPPSWMSEPQQEIWKFAIENAPRDLLKPIDAQVLVTWVIAADQHQTAAMQQNEADRGSRWPLLSADKERLTMSLYVKIMDQAGARMLRAASELGFSPTSRPKLSAPVRAAKGDDPQDFWDRFKAPGNAA
jgi:P27 family predicted phage terminase small subunit